MDYFKLCFKLYIIYCIINKSVSIQQQLFKNIIHCSTAHHIQARDIIIEEIRLPFAIQCFKKCSDSLDCGVVMYDYSNNICSLVDKGHLVCDEDIGVYELVSTTGCELRLFITFYTYMTYHSYWQYTEYNTGQHIDITIASRNS